METKVYCLPVVGLARQNLRSEEDPADLSSRLK